MGKLFKIGAVVLVLAVASGVITWRVDFSVNYKNATSLMNSENLEDLQEAYGKLKKLGNFKDCEKLLQKVENSIGYYYENSDDEESAVEWYTKAAKSGYEVAEYNLGEYYYQQEEYDTAVEWLTKAAEQENADAEYLLGCCYYTGDGVKKDKKSAKEWLEKAADAGNQEAQSYLEKID